MDIITLSEARNDMLREKLGGLFLSMEKNLSVQTDTLKGMYKLQKTAYSEERETRRDNERSERLKTEAVEEAANQNAPQTPQIDEEKAKSGAAGGLLGLLGNVFRGLSIPKIIGLIGKGVLYATVAGLVQGFVETTIEDLFAKLGLETGDGTVASTFAENLGSAAAWGVIGSFFGRRIALLLPGAFLGYKLGSAAVEKFNEMFGTNLDPEFWGYIGGAIGGLLALRLPGLILGAIAAGIAKLRLPPIFPDPDDVNTRPGTPRPNQRPQSNNPAAQRARFLADLSDKDLADRNITRTTDQAGRQQYQRNGRIMSSNDLNEAVDEILDAKRARVNGRIGGLMKVLGALGLAWSAYRVYEIYESDKTPDEKAQAYSEEFGGLFGGIGGAAIAAGLLGLAGSAIPGWGNVAGMLAGGIAGGFAGSWLAGNIAQWAIGGTTEPVPSEFESLTERVPLPSDAQGQMSGLKIIARPTANDEAYRGIDAQRILVRSQLTNMGIYRPDEIDNLVERDPRVAHFGLTEDQAIWDEYFAGLVPETGGTLNINEMTAAQLSALRGNIPAAPTLTPGVDLTTQELSPEMQRYMDEVLSMNPGLARDFSSAIAPVIVSTGSGQGRGHSTNNNTTIINQTLDYSSSLSNANVIPFR